MSTTNNTALIRQLEREVELLRDKYRTEQSLHAQTERHNAKLTAELEEMQRLYQVAVKEREEALRHLEQVRALLGSVVSKVARMDDTISSLEDNQ